jgi:chromosome segregation ATPase
MLKLIKHALNAADEIVENIENATEDAADKLERITDVILEDDESLKKKRVGEIEEIEENFDSADAEENTDHLPDEEPIVEKEIDGELESAAEATIASLLEEISTLKEQIAKLEALKQTEARILAEIGDFVALFPDVPVEELPDEVWESVRAGAPLAASYALYERKKAAKAKRVAEINQKNASRSPGAAGTDTASEYFTPDEVRRMSRAEVHANYSKIKESMKKWMQK